MSEGFTHRIRGLDAAGIRGLIERYVGRGAAFGGNIVELTPPRNFSAAGELEQGLRDWDFGHAFSKAAEVRWRRVVAFDSDAPDSFDALLLAEQSIGELSDVQIAGPWQTQASQNGTAILLAIPEEARLSYIRYLAPNGAVQYTRYTEVLP